MKRSHGYLLIDPAFLQQRIAGNDRATADLSETLMPSAGEAHIREKPEVPSSPTANRKEFRR